MNTGKEKLRPVPIASSPLTRVVGVVNTQQGPTPYYMSDQECARLVSSALAHDVAGAITRGTGVAPPRGERRAGRGDAMGWSGRQQGAAYELSRLWRAALPVRGFPRGYAGAAGGNRGDVSPEEAQDAQEAWDGYCVAMDEVLRCCSAKHAQMLQLTIVYDEPARLETAWLVREALSFLADHWNIK